MGDTLEFEILPGSESYDRERFPYPSEVRFRRNGQSLTRQGFDFTGVTLTQGRVADRDGVEPDALWLRMRNVGGELERGDGIVLYAVYGESQFPVGWFSIKVRADHN